jgi:hypothetical protein
MSSIQSSAGKVAVGGIYHVVGTYDGATTRLYVNGALVASQDAAGPFSGSSAPIYIASRAGLDLFRGVLDEVAVYGEPLTASMIADHHRIGAGGTLDAPPPPPPSPPPPPPPEPPDDDNVVIPYDHGSGLDPVPDEP